MLRAQGGGVAPDGGQYAVNGIPAFFVGDPEEAAGQEVGTGIPGQSDTDLEAGIVTYRSESFVDELMRSPKVSTPGFAIQPTDHIMNAITDPIPGLRISPLQAALLVNPIGPISAMIALGKGAAAIGAFAEGKAPEGFVGKGVSLLADQFGIVPGDITIETDPPTDPTDHSIDSNQTAFSNVFYEP
jgi:hypothetical protein